MKKLMIAALVLTALTGCLPRHAAQPASPQHVLSLVAEAATTLPITVTIEIDDASITGRQGAHGVTDTLFGQVNAANPETIRNLRTPYRHNITYAVGVNATVIFTVSYAGSVSGKQITAWIERDGVPVTEKVTLTVPRSGVSGAHLKVSYTTGTD